MTDCCLMKILLFGRLKNRQGSTQGHGRGVVQGQGQAQQAVLLGDDFDLRVPVQLQIDVQDAHGLIFGLYLYGWKANNENFPMPLNSLPKSTGVSGNLTDNFEIKI